MLNGFVEDGAGRLPTDRGLMSPDLILNTLSLDSLSSADVYEMLIMIC